MDRIKAALFGAIVATMASAPLGAFAQTPPAPSNACAPGEVDGKGKPLSFPTKIDERTLVSIGAASLLALSGPEPDWPSGDFRLSPLCEVDRMTVGQDEFVLNRNSGDGPRVWAQSATSGYVVFLALGPNLPSAHQWYTKDHGSSMVADGPSYLLTLMRRDDPKLYVTRMYDNLPPLERLKADISATLEQKLPTIVIYDRDERRTSVRLPSRVRNGDRYWR
jgi:hypothetical protein